MASPLCQVKFGAGAYASTTNGINATAGSVVVINLISSIGAPTWAIACVYADDLSTVATVNASLTIDPAGRTATFTAPVAGRGYIFQSVINAGNNLATNQPDPTTATTFGIWVPTASGARVLIPNETFESSSTSGWVADVNFPIRNPSTGGGTVATGTGIPHIVGGLQNAAATLIVDADVSATAAIALSKLAPGTNGDLLVYSAGAWNRLPIGSTGQTLQVVSGLPAWVSTTFDPSTFAWGGWWRASYAASPWAGAASAGSSSGRSLTETTNPATAGSAVNGYTPANLNSTTTKLNGSGVAWIGQSSYTMMALVKLTAYAGSTQTNPYDYPFIVADTPGNWGMYVTTTGVGLYHNDTAVGVKSITAAMTSSAWHLVVATYDGTNITIFIDGVQSAQLAAIDLDPTYPSAPIYVGQNYAGAQHVACQLLELGLSGNAMTVAQMSGMKSSFNARYGLSL